MKQEIYNEKLQTLNEDEVMVDAIKEVFIQSIEFCKPEINKGDSNQQLGEKYRAYMKSKEILNQAFLKIESYKVNYNKNTNFNKGK